MAPLKFAYTFTLFLGLCSAFNAFGASSSSTDPVKHVDTGTLVPTFKLPPANWLLKLPKGIHSLMRDFLMGPKYTRHREFRSLIIRGSSLPKILGVQNSEGRFQRLKILQPLSDSLEKVDKANIVHAQYGRLSYDGVSVTLTHKATAKLIPAPFHSKIHEIKAFYFIHNLIALEFVGKDSPGLCSIFIDPVTLKHIEFDYKYLSTRFGLRGTRGKGINSFFEPASSKMRRPEDFKWFLNEGAIGWDNGCLSQGRFIQTQYGLIDLVAKTFICVRSPMYTSPEYASTLFLLNKECLMMFNWDLQCSIGHIKLSNATTLLGTITSGIYRNAFVVSDRHERKKELRRYRLLVPQQPSALKSLVMEGCLAYTPDCDPITSLQNRGDYTSDDNFVSSLENKLCSEGFSRWDVVPSPEWEAMRKSMAARYPVLADRYKKSVSYVLRTRALDLFWPWTNQVVNNALELLSDPEKTAVISPQIVSDLAKVTFEQIVGYYTTNKNQWTCIEDVSKDLKTRFPRAHAAEAFIPGKSLEEIIIRELRFLPFEPIGALPDATA